MSIFSKIAAWIFAPVTASGAPRGADMADVQIWGTELEMLVAALVQGGSAAVFETRAQLFANLNYDANAMAWVVADSMTAYNGIYRKNGSSGTGSWTRVADLPFSFVRMVDVGAGTPNAIQVTSTIPTSASMIRISNIVDPNTFNVTISENGGTPKPLRTNTGNEVAAAGLTSGSYIMYVELSTEFRMLNDQVSAAIVAAAEAAQAAAEDARDAALSAVPNSYPVNVAALKALDTGTITSAYLKEAGRAGQFAFRSGDYSAQITNDTQEGVYIKADDTASSAGAWVRLFDGPLNANWYGIVSDGTTDQTSALTTLLGNLGTAGFRGFLNIPYATKFALKTVYAAVPTGIVLQDDSSVNYGQPPTYKNRFRVLYSGDIVADDTQSMVASGHHPAINLNNFGTAAGSPSAEARFASILFSGGVDPFGDPIVGFMQQQGKVTSLEQWRMSWFLYTPWEFVKQQLWQPSTAVLLNDIIITSARRVYRVTTAGTTHASTEPTHVAGTVANGTAQLLYLQTGASTGNTRLSLQEDGTLIQIGPGTVTHSMRAIGSGNFVSDLIADDVENTFSVLNPANSHVQFGISGSGPDTASKAGISCYRGASAGQFTHYVISGLSGGTEQVVANLISANHTAAQYRTANTIVGSISCTTSATAFNTSSDYRMKYDVESIVASFEMPGGLPPALDKIMRLRPVRYKWKHLPDDQEWSYGQIAHEAQAVTPYAVTGEKDAVEAVGTITMPDETVVTEEIVDENGNVIQEASTRVVSGKIIENCSESEAQNLPDGATFVKTGERAVNQQMDPSKQIADLLAAVQELTLLNVAQAERIAVLEAR